MKALIVLLVILVVLGILVGVKFVGVRNDLTRQRADVDRLWSEIDADLQRRADVIPDLLAVVKGHAKDETGIMETIAKLRPEMVSGQSRRQKIDAYDQMNNALRSLSAVLENYPNLKATDKFKSLRFRLGETQDSILQARQRYNEAVKKYNTTLSLFPSNIVARLSGFSRDDAYFKTDVNAPAVPF